MRLCSLERTGVPPRDRAMAMPRCVVAVFAVALIASNTNAHEDGHGTGHDHSHLPVDYSLDGQDLASPQSAQERDEAGYAWWKGNLHAHTLWSDGDQFPEVIVDWYVRHGYHFLALSDHNVLLRGQKWIDPATNRFAQRGGGMDVYELYRERFGDRWVETRQGDGGLEVRVKPLGEFRHLFEQADRFLLIESEEISEQVHVNATNIAQYIPPQGGSTIEEMIRNNIDAVLEQREASGQMIMPHLNHPNFRWTIRAEDMVPVENLRFFEVYNGASHTHAFGEGPYISLERMWDIMLTLRLAERGLGAVYGLAVDDAHDYEQSTRELATPGRGWVMVRAPFLTPEHLIRAMEAGDFYATTGVILDRVERSADRLAVSVRAEPGVTYTIRFIGTRADYSRDRHVVRDEDGDPLDTTMVYSDDIGKVFHEVEADEANYQLRGDELYVRATIISSRLTKDPHMEGEREMAWVQPTVPEH